LPPRKPPKAIDLTLKTSIATPFAQGLARWGWLAAWAVFVAVAVSTRGLWPIDETRYATVAWEMWQNGQWLVPHLNGAPYPHKPPVLFWLMQLGWAVFGVSDLWPRLIAPMAGLSTAWLARRMAGRLWPESPDIQIFVPWLLLFGLYWAGFHSMLMFDAVLALWAMLAMTGLWQAASRPRKGFAVLGGALALGLLTKGPIILLFVLPPALLAPLWHPAWPGWRIWGAGLIRALGIMALIALIWALPAAILGGKGYAADLLWRQSAGRALESFAHRRPWWWYLPILPLMLLPWSLFPSVYRAGATAVSRAATDRGVRFCLATLLPGFVLCSMISGKQPHYLLPLFPALMLLVAHGLTQAPGRLSLRPTAGALAVLAVLLTVAPLWLRLRGDSSWLTEVSPLWGLGLAPIAYLFWRMPPAGYARQVPLLGALMAALLVFAHGSVIREAQTRFDLTETSRMLGALERTGHPLAFVGTYRGQFQFLGRLKQVPDVLKDHEAARAWAAQHPGGVIVDEVDHKRDCTAPPSILCRPYRGHYLVLREASQLGGNAPTNAANAGETM